MSSAFPAIFRVLMRSTTVAAASRAASCPTSPAAMGITLPSSRIPRPLMCVCVAMRLRSSLDFTSSIFIDMAAGGWEGGGEEEK